VTVVQLEPLSGPFREVGELSIAGVQFLVDGVNTVGGLLGKKIKYIPEDSQLKPDVAVRKGNKAILEDHARIILQLNSTAAAQALMDVAEKNKVLFVTLRTESDFLIRTLGADGFFPIDVSDEERLSMKKG
jgi:ABC-type branched-subunit amino acid transport system substrate-binding protein